MGPSMTSQQEAWTQVLLSTAVTTSKVIKCWAPHVLWKVDNPVK